jgi:hypothetical protein
VRRPRERHLGASPREPRVALHDIVEQIPCESGRHGGERVQRARRLVYGYSAAALLDELDEAVRGVERQLHSHMVGEHMFACKEGSTAAGRGRLSGPANAQGRLASG